MSKFDTQALFKKESKRLIRRGEQLTWAFDAFLSAHAHSEVLKAHYDRPNSEWALSAFFRAIVSDYSKVFTTSRSNFSRSGFSEKYLTKNPDFDKKCHEQILDIRNLCVAHSEENLEQQTVHILLSRAASSQPNRTKEDAVYIPIQFEFQSKSVWFTNNADFIERLENHCKSCMEHTRSELNVLAKELRDLMLENARYANSLDSCFVYEKATGGRIDGTPFPNLDTTGNTIQLKVGNDKFDFRGVTLEVVPPLEEKVTGAGYIVEPQGSQGEISYKVTFEDET